MSELEIALRAIAKSWRRYPYNKHLPQLAEAFEAGADAISQTTGDQHDDPQRLHEDRPTNQDGAPNSTSKTPE